jgi:hypothetical protein
MIAEWGGMSNIINLTTFKPSFILKNIGDSIHGNKRLYDRPEGDPHGAGKYYSKELSTLMCSTALSAFCWDSFQPQSLEY